MGQFARLLPEFGWDVTVLTAKHDGVDSNAVEALEGRATIVHTWSPSTAIKRGAPVPRRGIRGLTRNALRSTARFALFPDREIFWAPGAIAAGTKLLHDVGHDVVFATYGPASDLVVGSALAHKLRLPLVVDFRDLWATSPVSLFTTPLHRLAARRLEQRVVRESTRLVAVAPQMAADLATSHGVAPDRAIAITNGYDPDDVERVHDNRGTNAPFRLMYCGSIHSDYDLDPFWRAIKTLAARGVISPQTFRIEFVGNLAVSDLRALGVDVFVDTKPFVAHAKVFDELARADALLVVETPGYYAQYGYAAKVFDYILTGKPVVGLVETGSNTARLLGDAGVGYCAELSDEAGITAALERVLALKGAAPRRVDCDAAPFAAFNRRNLVARLATTLNDVVRTEPRGHW
jgi:glycosyltransferase involved in cell wall biosynthesis